MQVLCFSCLGWVDNIRNEEVLGEEKKLWQYVVCGRNRLIGSNLHHSGLLNMLMEGKIVHVDKDSNTSIQ